LEVAKRILLVEDESELAEVLGDELRGEGYEVVTATSGLQALDLIREWSDSIDLLIADVVLPEFSGIALAHKLRKRAPDSKILLMSGYGQILLEETGFPVLAKPLAPHVLLEKARELLNP
jgi:two-component system cell cycle sensor histidine kinase/response regulator CckA